MVIILWLIVGAPILTSSNPGLTPIAGYAEADIDNLSLYPFNMQMLVGCIVIVCLDSISIVDFLTIKINFENWLTVFSCSSTRDKARHISKLGWSHFKEVSRIGIPERYWLSWKELVWKTPTSNRLSIRDLLNSPGFGPKWPPSAWTGLHGSWTIENQPEPIEFIRRLPLIIFTFATPSLSKPNK